MPASYEQQTVLAGDLHARPAGTLAVAAGREAVTALIAILSQATKAGA